MKLVVKTLAVAGLIGLSVGATLPAQAQAAPPTHRFNIVGRALFDQGNGSTYTMFGFEMLRVNAAGWTGGLGMYKGLNLGDSINTDYQSQGGFILGKDTDLGPLAIGAQVLAGMGCGVVASPTLTFSGFGAYFLGEPRVSLAIRPMPNFEVRISGSYLFTTRPTQASGPAVMLTLSFPRPHRMAQP